MPYSYLLEKIRSAAFTEEPYRHIQINNFFNPQDFKDIISASEIALPVQTTDEGLFDSLFANGYKIIEFPGCITNKDTYISWHKSKKQNHHLHNTSCEGFGVTVRLTTPQSKIIHDLAAFLNSSEFQRTLAEKFDIAMPDVFYDAGIQKYLDGYEISPHPDIRRKALTYMVNINPSLYSETSEHHTHYLTFKDSYKYVQTYWEGNPTKDRCWVPWDWCESKKTQPENNSMVIFSPNNATMHGVKANYDHLIYQRTQLYGNLWYHAHNVVGTPSWEDLQIKCNHKNQTGQTLKAKIKSMLSEDMLNFLSKHLGKKQSSGSKIRRIID